MGHCHHGTCRYQTEQNSKVSDKGNIRVSTQHQIFVTQPKHICPYLILDTLSSNQRWNIRNSRQVRLRMRKKQWKSQLETEGRINTYGSQSTYP